MNDSRRTRLDRFDSQETSDIPFWLSVTDTLTRYAAFLVLTAGIYVTLRSNQLFDIDLEVTKEMFYFGVTIRHAVAVFFAFLAVIIIGSRMIPKPHLRIAIYSVIMLITLGMSVGVIMYWLSRTASTAVV